MERLQKYMSSAGIASRRKSEELIKEGKVSVDGVIIKEMGYIVKGNEEIAINGIPVAKEEKEYYILNKPAGVVCTTKDEKNRKTVTELINTEKKIYPVGRLDYDTTGLLILTNDGELTNKLTHPSGNIEKEYSVKIEGILNKEAVHSLVHGVVINNVKTKEAKVKIKKIDKYNNKSYANIILTEGRNHEVKDMFASLGYKVIKLKRIRYSFLTLEDIKLGEYRRLTIKEIKKLYSESI
ncbi:MAG: pseudouridine synthase [Bacilli bacterium]